MKSRVEHFYPIARCCFFSNFAFPTFGFFLECVFRLVYEKEDYKDHWRGQDFKDRELPDATYFYYLLLRSGEERTGWVYKTH